MKWPTINATVLTVTLAICGTAVWCVERIRPADRPRYEYFEDSGKDGHYIIEVDTVTGHIRRERTSRQYASFQHPPEKAGFDKFGDWIAGLSGTRK
jgi:hypothetical protein